MAEVHAPETPVEAAPKRGPGVMTLVKGAAIVSVVVLLEAAAATMFIPSAAETKAIAQELAKSAHAPPDGHAAQEDAKHEQNDDHEAYSGHGGGHGAATKEVPLGTYHVVSFNPTTQTSLNIDFELFGIVLAAEEEDFNHMFALHEKRINEQVTIAIRGMEAADFTDPGLGLIKRIILEKTNRALGKPLVREAVFSEFSFMER
jgi:flagellar FliL protein